MNISIFGLGNAGLIALGSLAKQKMHVIGVDILPEKVAKVARGEAPLVEPGLSKLLKEGIANKYIEATLDPFKAVAQTETSLVYVGTPSKPTGEVDLSFVYEASRSIGRAIRKKKKSHVVVINSTVPPGTTRNCYKILQKEAGKIPVHIACNPEFLREGVGIKDYMNPPYIIIGTKDALAEKKIRLMYAFAKAKIILCQPEIAEMVKYTANAWHATKITFANEIGRLAKEYGLDGREVMEIIGEDKKLNVSPHYLKPGFAFGGSCLSKDIAAFTLLKKQQQPLLQSLLVSNSQQIELAKQIILKSGKKKVGILGLSFKPNIDDVRGSPALDLANRLLNSGLDVRMYDPFIRKKGGFLEHLLVSEKDFMSHAQVIVITQQAKMFLKILEKTSKDCFIVDLIGIPKKMIRWDNYEGIAW